MATKSKKYQEALRQIRKSAASDKKKATNRPAKKKSQKATKPVKKQTPKKLIKKTQSKKPVIQKIKKIQKKEISKPKKKKQTKTKSVIKKRKTIQKKKSPAKTVSKRIKIKKQAVKKPIVKKRPIKKQKTKKPTIKKKAVKKPVKRKPVRKITKVKKVARIKKTIRPKKVAAKRTKVPTISRISMGKGILDQLFESTAKVKILKLFFRNTGEKFEPKEIYRRLRSSVSLLNREMKKLEKTGLLRKRKAWLEFETRQGVKKQQRLIYELDPGFGFFYELKNLILKEAIESKEELLEKVKKIGNIKLFVLCGLFVNDEASKADLLLVGDKINQKKLNNFIKDLEAEVGKEMNCAVMTTKEFNYRYDMYDRFIRDILTGKSEILIKKIILW